jgi:hypothetical protein
LLLLSLSFEPLAQHTQRDDRSASHALAGAPMNRGLLSYGHTPARRRASSDGKLGGKLDEPVDPSQKQLSTLQIQLGKLHSSNHLKDRFNTWGKSYHMKSGSK